jgi:O-antigen ligase
MSGSRATFFALTLMAILSFLRGCFSKRRLLSLAAIVGMIGIFYVSIPSFNSQVDRGFQEVATYIKITDPVRHEDHGSVGTRFELWRAGLLIFRDYPVLGIGWRNFSNVTTEYVSEGLINPQVLGHRHPHNTYIEFLNNSGLLGLLLLVSWGFVLWRHVSRVGSARQEPFGSGARLYLAFLGVSAINEGGLLIYGNSLSFYLVALAAIMSSLSYRR